MITTLGPSETPLPAPGNGRNGGMKSGSRRDKAECRLWVQKGDDRRNARQRAKSMMCGKLSVWCPTSRSSY